MSKFESVEAAQKFLNEIENNLKQFEDEAYNLNEENKANININIQYAYVTFSNPFI